MTEKAGNERSVTVIKRCDAAHQRKLGRQLLQVLSPFVYSAPATFVLSATGRGGGRLRDQSHQLTQVERLSYDRGDDFRIEIVRVVRGHDDHRRARLHFFQRSDHLKAAEARQHEVEQHQVIGIALEQFQSFRAVRDGINDEAVSCHDELEKSANARIIFDQKNSRFD